METQFPYHLSFCYGPLEQAENLISGLRLGEKAPFKMELSHRKCVIKFSKVTQ